MEGTKHNWAETLSAQHEQAFDTAHDYIFHDYREVIEAAREKAALLDASINPRQPLTPYSLDNQSRMVKFTVKLLLALDDIRFRVTYFWRWWGWLVVHFLVSVAIGFCLGYIPWYLRQ